MFKHTRLALLLLAGGLLPMPLAGQTVQAVDEIVQTSVVLGADEASLSLELDDGRSRQIRLVDGTVYIDGNEAARYRPGGALERAWRDFLRGASGGDFADALRGFVGAETEADDAAAVAILEALTPFSAEVSTEVAATVAAEESPQAAADWAKTVADAASAAAVAAATAQAVHQEVVSGGLVVETTQDPMFWENRDHFYLDLRKTTTHPEGAYLVATLLMDRLRGDWPDGAGGPSLGADPIVGAVARVLKGDENSPVRIVLEADDYTLPEGAELDHTLILVETDGVLAGTVTGNVLVAEGSLLIAPTGRVEGEVVAIDADVQNQGTVVGRPSAATAGSAAVMSRSWSQPAPITRTSTSWARTSWSAAPTAPT